MATRNAAAVAPKMSPRERGLCQRAVNVSKARSQDTIDDRDRSIRVLRDKLNDAETNLRRSQQARDEAFRCSETLHAKLAEAEATIARNALDGDANNKRWAKIMYEASLVTAERDSLKSERDAMAVTISVLKTDAELFRDLLRHMMGQKKT